MPDHQPARSDRATPRIGPADNADGLGRSPDHNIALPTEKVTVRFHCNIECDVGERSDQIAERPTSHCWPSRIRMRPSFLIIGAMKCGTTSLFKYLVKHPMVSKPKRKELHYFDRHFACGVEWYSRQFPLKSIGSAIGSIRNRPRVTGEASPSYLFHPHAPRRVAELLPDASLIVILRDPVHRAFSHYQHARRNGVESLSFEEAIDREQERIGELMRRQCEDESFEPMEIRRHSYVGRGQYAGQFERWLCYFDRSQLLVLDYAELFREPEKVWGRMLEFVGLPYWKLGRFEIHNKGVTSGDIPLPIHARLAEHFRPHNERLHRMLGVDFGWNSTPVPGQQRFTGTERQ